MLYTAMCVGEKEEETQPLPLHTMLDMVMSNMNAVYFKMAGGKKEEQRRAITIQDIAARFLLDSFFIIDIDLSAV